MTLSLSATAKQPAIPAVNARSGVFATRDTLFTMTLSDWAGGLTGAIVYGTAASTPATFADLTNAHSSSFPFVDHLTLDNAASPVKLTLGLDAGILSDQTPGQHFWLGVTGVVPVVSGTPILIANDMGVVQA